VDVVIWVGVYLVVIAALATWREHHDARAKEHSRTGRTHSGRNPARRLPLRALRGSLTHSHRTT
jgi:hypothetical protein